MDLLKLVRTKDGIDLAKLAAASAHFLMACSFLKFQVISDAPFNAEIWWVYGGFAIAHDAYNRVTGMVKDSKDKKAEVEAKVIEASTPVSSAANGATVSTVTTVSPN